MFGCWLRISRSHLLAFGAWVSNALGVAFVQTIALRARAAANTRAFTYHNRRRCRASVQGQWRCIGICSRLFLDDVEIASILLVVLATERLQSSLRTLTSMAIARTWRKSALHAVRVLRIFSPLEVHRVYYDSILLLKGKYLRLSFIFYSGEPNRLKESVLSNSTICNTYGAFLRRVAVASTSSRICALIMHDDLPFVNYFMAAYYCFCGASLRFICFYPTTSETIPR